MQIDPPKKAASLPANIPWSKVPGTSMKGMPDKMAAVKTLVTGMLSKPSLGKTASSADSFRISPKEASSLCQTNQSRFYLVVSWWRRLLGGSHTEVFL